MRKIDIHIETQPGTPAERNLLLATSPQIAGLVIHARDTIEIKRLLARRLEDLTGETEFEVTFWARIYEVKQP